MCKALRFFTTMAPFVLFAMPYLIITKDENFKTKSLRIREFNQRADPVSFALLSGEKLVQWTWLTWINGKEIIHSSKNTPLGWIDQVNHTKYATMLVNRLHIFTPSWRCRYQDIRNIWLACGKTIDEMISTHMGWCSSEGIMFLSKIRREYNFDHNIGV